MWFISSTGDSRMFAISLHEVRLQSGAKSTKSPCFDATSFAIARLHPVWKTGLSDMLIWTQVNDALAKNLIDYKSGALVCGRIGGGPIFEHAQRRTETVFEIKSKRRH